MAKKQLLKELEEHDIVMMREQKGHEICIGVVANFIISEEYFVTALQEFVDRWKAGEIDLNEYMVHDDGGGMH